MISETVIHIRDDFRRVDVSLTYIVMAYDSIRPALQRLEVHNIYMFIAFLPRGWASQFAVNLYDLVAEATPEGVNTIPAHVRGTFYLLSSQLIRVVRVIEGADCFGRVDGSR